MLEKFTQNNKAENIRRWITQVDLSSADILQTEREIYAALSKANRKKQSWASAHVAPLAEPVDMLALVGDLFNDAAEEINYQINRTNNLYSWLSATNNTLKAELDTVERLVTQATDDTQHISIVIGDENRNFYWVSDSFNNTTFVDKKNTTGLIDTDYGMAILSPIASQAVTDFSATIDRQTTKGIPGANLYVVNPGKREGNLDPQPILESNETRNFSAMFDQDPSSWFELERNFIPRNQKVKMTTNRSYVYTESGQEQDIQSLTKNYDWTANIVWPDGVQDSGEGNKGVPLVEWRDLENESPILGAALATPVDADLNTDAVLTIDVNFTVPISLSNIKLLPFVREDSLPIRIKTIEAKANLDTILIARDTELGTNRSTNLVQREIARRTGAQQVGSLITVPTDREITSIRVTLTSSPKKATNGLAHIFRDVLTEYRTERNHLLWRTADQWKDWARRAFNESVPKITSYSATPGIVGTLVSGSNIAYTALRVARAVNDRNIEKTKNDILKDQKRNLSEAKEFMGNNATLSSNGDKIFGTDNPAKVNGDGTGAGTIQDFVNSGLIKPGFSTTLQAGLSKLGSVGSWLNKAIPVVGNILALNDLVGGFFAVDKSTNVLEDRLGYDVFKGHRAAIAIRSLEFLKSVYTTESIIQSTKREFPGLVSKVGVFVDEMIPEQWGPGDWISYYLSTDGSNWTVVPKLTDTSLERSLTLSSPTKTIYFKAVIKGNSYDPYHTPQLKHYSIQGLPAG